MMKKEIRLHGLFEEYGEKRFLKWCRSLEIFRFCKSHPYPDDLTPDRFIALIHFKEREELVNIIKEIKLSFFEKDIMSYLQQTNEKLISGEASIKNINCHITINEIVGYLEIAIIGIKDDPFALTADTFERTKSIDNYLQTLDIEFEKSPYGDDYCITPEFYPEVWL